MLIKPFNRSLALAISTVVLTGCARYAWQKPGATQVDFNQDQYSCMVQAAQLFPVHAVPVQISSGWSVPATTNCYGTSNGTGTLWGNSIQTNNTGNMNCTTVGGNAPQPITVPVDVNKENRIQAAQQCMFSKGWQYMRVDR